MPVTRSIRLGTRPCRGVASRAAPPEEGTAGCATGVGRAGPGSTGRGAINAPLRTAALSAALAAGRTGSDAPSARFSAPAGSPGPRRATQAPPHS